MWTPAAEEELRAWRVEVEEAAEKHAVAARKCKFRHLVLSGTHAALAGAASAVGALGGECVSGMLMSGLSAAVAALGGLALVLHLEAKSERHDRASDTYESVSRYITWHLALEPDLREHPRTVFMYTSSRIDAIEEFAPLV